MTNLSLLNLDNLMMILRVIMKAKSPRVRKERQLKNQSGRGLPVQGIGAKLEIINQIHLIMKVRILLLAFRRSK